jgi:hypothetical protein
LIKPIMKPNIINGGGIMPIYIIFGFIIGLIKGQVDVCEDFTNSTEIKPHGRMK